MLVIPKPQELTSRTARLPKRRRVTLIANFPSVSAFAICADSQETVTEHDPETNTSYDVRATVQKITPIAAGKYQVAICGGGHADLIEGFIEKAKRAVQKEDRATCTSKNPASLKRLHRRLELELARFYRTDVATCPDASKNFKLFIAACFPLAKEFDVWVSENAVLRPARRDRAELNGWSHKLYEDTAQRLFRAKMTANQAVLASIYTVTVAKNTSNYVRDPLDAAVIDGTGIHIIEPNYVKAMEERLEEYEVRIHALFLSCSDVGVSVPELEAELQKFGKSAIELHREQIDRQADAMTVNDLFANRGMRSLPKGPVHWGINGKLRVEHDPVKIEATRKRFEIAKILAGEGPVIVTVSCPKGHTFEREFANRKSAYGKIVECDTCGERKILREMGQGAPDDIRLKDPKQLDAQK